MYQFIPCYASAINKHTHTPILKPFEVSEPTGINVDVAVHATKYVYLREDGVVCRCVSLQWVLVH